MTSHTLMQALARQITLSLYPVLAPVKINDRSVVIDPQILFTRLMLLMHKGMEDSAQCFEYELTPMPTALFKDGALRKTDKSLLTKELVKDVDTTPDSILFAGHFVTDGGYLLHKV